MFPNFIPVPVEEMDRYTSWKQICDQNMNISPRSCSGETNHSEPERKEGVYSLARLFFIMTMALRNMRISTSL